MTCDLAINFDYWAFDYVNLWFLLNEMFKRFFNFQVHTKFNEPSMTVKWKIHTFVQLLTIIDTIKSTVRYQLSSCTLIPSAAIELSISKLISLQSFIKVTANNSASLRLRSLHESSPNSSTTRVRFHFNILTRTMISMDLKILAFTPYIHDRSWTSAEIYLLHKYVDFFLSKFLRV